MLYFGNYSAFRGSQIFPLRATFWRPLLYRMVSLITTIHCNCEPWTGLFKPTTSEHGGSSSAVDWDCATCRKVAGSIPDIFIGVSHWRNPSGRSVALGSTQPLTGMSKGIGKSGRCVGLTNWQHSCADYLEILEPQQPGNLRDCPRFDLSLPFTLIIYLFPMHFNIISRLPTNLIFFSNSGFPKGREI